MLYKTTVEKGTLALIKKLSADKIFESFNLVGGTALALQIGHRLSVDIDLFSNQPFDSKSLSHHLSNNYKAAEIHILDNGIFCYVNGVKIDVISHQYDWLLPSEKTEGVRMASLEDIAAMKLNAIVHTGKRLKDFVDVYFLLEHRSTDQLIQAYTRKYPETNANIAKMALLYHKDIRLATSVDLLGRELKWSDIAQRLKQAVAHPDKLFSEQHRASNIRQDGKDKPRTHS